MTAADNLVDEWVGHNLLTTDPALLASLQAAAPQAVARLTAYGEELDSGGRLLGTQAQPQAAQILDAALAR